MKRIKMLNLQTEGSENITTDNIEDILLKRKCFNEGWWKGFICSTVSYTAGLMIGGIMLTKIFESKEEEA